MSPTEGKLQEGRVCVAYFFLVFPRVWLQVDDCPFYAKKKDAPKELQRKSRKK